MGSMGGHLLEGVGVQAGRRMHHLLVKLAVLVSFRDLKHAPHVVQHLAEVSELPLPLILEGSHLVEDIVQPLEHRIADSNLHMC